MAVLAKGEGGRSGTRPAGQLRPVRRPPSAIEGLAWRLEAAVARLESLERELHTARSRPPDDDLDDPAALRAGPLLLDGSTRRGYLDDRDLRLSPLEYRVLRELVRRAGRAVAHGELLRRVWGPEYGSETHYVKVYANRLRAKLEAAGPNAGCRIETIWGVGYRVVVEA